MMPARADDGDVVAGGVDVAGAARERRAVTALRVLAAFVRRAALEAGSYRAAQLVKLLGAALALLSLVFLARLVDAAPNPHLARYPGYVGFALVGLVLSDLQRAAGSSLSLRLREAQLQGTLEAVLATPAPVWLVVAGTVLPDLLAALGRSAAYLAVAGLLLDVPLGRADVGAVAAALALSLLAFAGLGLAGGAVTLALRRGDSFGALLVGGSLVAGGVLYPTTVLPPAVQWIGRLLPVTPALEAVRRALLLGEGLEVIAPQLRALAIFAALVLPVGALAFAAALRHARATGSLASY